MNKFQKSNLMINKKSKDKCELVFTLELTREDAIKRKEQLELDLNNYEFQLDYISEQKKVALLEIEKINEFLNNT